MRARRSSIALGIATLVTALTVIFWPRVVVGARIVGMKLGTPKSVAERLDELVPRVRARLEPSFRSAGIAWPPRRILLVAYKEERHMDVFAAADPTGGDMQRVTRYPVLAASGGPGPKLRSGDRQVPEGVYGIEALNPMSRFHVALRVGYPNASDRERAAEDGRTDLGGDIMMHGGEMSVGCLAMGDDAAEDLFVIAALAGIENVSIWIAPCDLAARTDVVPPPGAPPWTPALWSSIRARLVELGRERSDIRPERAKDSAPLRR